MAAEVNLSSPTPWLVDMLIRPDVVAMEAYTPIVPFEVLSQQLGRSPAEIVKLDANENPYGPSPKARAALAGLDSTAPCVARLPVTRALMPPTFWRGLGLTN